MRDPEKFLTIFEKSNNCPLNHHKMPVSILPEVSLEEMIPKEYLEEDHGFSCDEILILPEVSEVEVVRHYVELSHRNYGVDDGIYPLGSCTMKYNPKINESVADFEGFRNIHPFQPNIQGCLHIIYELEKNLCAITGMDAFSLQPAAGAHGEFLGISLMKKYFSLKKEQKTKIIIPDSAHGTNPASSAMCGYSVVVIKSNDDGEVSLDELEFAMKQGDVAGIMLTNPNTLGLFERNILLVTEIVHKYGGLTYYDGANMNALLGKCKPGDMGFDIVHLNLHKTFSTPHGGGGPGSGPVGVKSFLTELLPIPRVVKKSESYEFDYQDNESIGKIKTFYGNFGILVRAYTYIKMLGKDGLIRASENAVLNANYLRVNLMDKYNVPFKRICHHEFIMNDKDFPNDVKTTDIAKRLLDYRIYAPTIHFPLIVPGSIMIEPTETEPKNSLDNFIKILLKIREEANTTPDLLKNAPVNTPIGRLDEVQAKKTYLKI